MDSITEAAAAPVPPVQKKNEQTNKQTTKKLLPFFPHPSLIHSLYDYLNIFMFGSGFDLQLVLLLDAL